MILVLQGVAVTQESPLTLRGGDHAIHILPTINSVPPPSDPGPLLYNGGSVMQASVAAFAIFWIPPALQNGGATTLPASYQTVQTHLLKDYPGHGLDTNNTQYYQTTTGPQLYIQNKGSFGGSFIDTSAYPPSGCSDSATPGNCITDAQVQAEILKVMAIKGWTGGLNKMFLLFTSSGEGSCFDSTNAGCAYVQYCGYHGFISGTTPVIYSNEPFGNTTVCQVPGTPSPNSNPAADAAATVVSHELTEATTDPELNAWFSAQGNEIGDLCNFNYGTNTWDSGKANQMWNGHFYELQMEFDNHAGGCVQVGP
jgi:hypothetical protein